MDDGRFRVVFAFLKKEFRLPLPEDSANGVFLGAFFAVFALAFDGVFGFLVFWDDVGVLDLDARSSHRCDLVSHLAFMCLSQAASFTTRFPHMGHLYIASPFSSYSSIVVMRDARVQCLNVSRASSSGKIGRYLAGLVLNLVVFDVVS